MYGAYIADPCPHCGEHQMPPLTPGSRANARMCQNCGWVEELDPATGKPVPTPGPAPAPEAEE